MTTKELKKLINTENEINIYRYNDMYIHGTKMTLAELSDNYEIIEMYIHNNIIQLSLIDEED